MLEEGCHVLYYSGEIGSSTFSADSWCSRFLIDSSSKIGSKFQRPILAWLIQGEIPLSFVSSLLLWSETICMVFFGKLVQLHALLFCPSDCELWFTMIWISEESIVNTCEMSTLRVQVSCSISSTHSRLYGTLSVLRFLPCRAPRLRPFFITKFRTESASSLGLCNFLLDSLSTKNCPQEAIHNSLISNKKTVRTLHFW